MKKSRKEMTVVVTKKLFIFPTCLRCNAGMKKITKDFSYVTNLD